MLTGQKVILRSLKKEDWEKTIVWRNDPELSKLVMSHPFPITEQMEWSWYDAELNNVTNKVVYFGIVDKETKELIGFAFLKNINWINHNCSLGILIGEQKSHGKGYGKEVMQILINYAFGSLNLLKITLEVVGHNKLAINLYEKLGFIREGLLKNQYYSNNNYHDVHIMSLYNNHAES